MDSFSETGTLAMWNVYQGVVKNVVAQHLRHAVSLSLYLLLVCWAQTH